MKVSTAPLDDALHQFSHEMRVAMPATVVSFDPGPQYGFPSVSVQPVIREVMNQNAVPTAQPLPILDAVPVLCPGGGGFNLTFPIAEGDECLLVFSDMCIDLWKQNGGLQNQPAGFRFRHDIGDAIAIFGLQSAPTAIANWSTTSTQLRSADGTVVIDLSADGILIEAPAITIGPTGGTPQALLTEALLVWLQTELYPWAVAHGYTGSTIPLNSATTTVKGE
jgi:hypothetical protein